MLFRSSPSSDGDPTTTHNLHVVVRTLLWWLAITVATVVKKSDALKGPRYGN